MSQPITVFDLLWQARSWQRLRTYLSLAMAAVVGSQATFGQDWTIKQDVDPKLVVGDSKCAECHASEVAAWKKSPHFTAAFALLAKGEAKEISGKLGVTPNDSRCTTCHNTQGPQGNLKVISCESCHGGAGKHGERPGWLEAHHYFGNKLDPKDPASRNKETESHYKKRLAYCDKTGMRRSENLYALAKNCYECHTVPAETLVNKGGHPTETKGFEFVEFAQGEVRHNFQLDQTKNSIAPTVWTNARFAKGTRNAQGHLRLMYVLGQVADAEVSLRNRAQATGRGKFLDAANKRILAAKKSLEDIHQEAAIAEVKTLLDALAPVKRTTLRKVTGNDKNVYGSMAAVAAAVGPKLAASYDGANWQKINAPTKSKGDVYKP